MRNSAMNNKSKKCIVHGCDNRETEGGFVGELCSPCHKMLTTGVLTPTNSFLGHLKRCEDFTIFVNNDYIELSHEKVEWQRNDWAKRAKKALLGNDERRGNNSI